MVAIHKPAHDVILKPVVSVAEGQTIDIFGN